MAPSKPQNTRSLASRLSAQSRKSFRGPRRTPVIPLSADTTPSLCQPRRVNITSRPISSTTSNVVCSQARVGGQTQRSTTPDIGSNDDDDDVQDSVIAVIDRNGQNTVGCAVYHAREGLLRCMEDVKEIDGGLFDTLNTDIKPTVLLLTPRSESMIGTELARARSIGIDTESEPFSSYKLEIRPTTDFKYEEAIHKLAALDTLESMPGVRFLVPGHEDDHGELDQADELDLTDKKGRTLHVSACLDLGNRISVGCAGALITHLQRKGASELAEQRYRIIRVEMFTLKDTMLVNADTLSALQIIQPESHPSVTNQGPGSSGAKESLSIYGLFYHYAKTPQGRECLRQMFLHPSLSIDEIRQRQDAILILTQSDNRPALQNLHKSLGRIKNMKRIVVQLHKGIEGGSHIAGNIKSGVWSSLLDFCYHIIEILDTLKETNDIQQVVLYQQILEVFSRNEFQALGKTIWDTVDLDESQSQHRTVVKRGIHAQLDEIKDAYDSMDELLQWTALEVVHEMPRGYEVPPINVVYFPQLGFHVALPLDDETLEPTHRVPETWERAFATGNQAYYKTERMHTMDHDLGDLYGMICDMEIELSHGLSQVVLGKEALLTTASELCGELDSLVALALGAIEYRLSRPRIVEANVIEIRGGRHILQEMTVPSYVPNDAFLVGGSAEEDDPRIEESPRRGPCMLLLTGPNYSGKSVYLKQVALICYMAQVGSFVPAEYAKIGISDRIMTRITTRETVSKGQSAFMIDLQQIAWALRSCTSRSLLIIDEFGKGTDNCDGAGLAAGVLKHLLSLGRQSPKVLASTHFHELFEHDFIRETTLGLGLLQMAIQIDRTDRGRGRTSDSTVTYLYNVRSGRNSMSYGTQCAAINGIPDVVVHRASILADLAVKGEDLTAICASIGPEEAEELQDAERVSRAFVATDLRGEGIENVKAYLESILGESKPSEADSTCTSAE